MHKMVSDSSVISVLCNPQCITRSFYCVRIWRCEQYCKIDIGPLLKHYQQSAEATVTSSQYLYDLSFVSNDRHIWLIMFFLRSQWILQILVSASLPFATTTLILRSQAFTICKFIFERWRWWGWWYFPDIIRRGVQIVSGLLAYCLIQIFNLVPWRFKASMTSLQTTESRVCITLASVLFCFTVDPFRISTSSFVWRYYWIAQLRPFFRCCCGKATQN